MKYVATLLWVLGSLLLVGCSSTKEYAFDVSVRNATDEPITIWLTKEGPPIEEGWRSPEQVAIQSPGQNERIGGRLVPPGKTASTNGPFRGKFEPGSTAWLRIYEGRYSSFSDLLAVSSKSSKRTDQYLEPGVNRLVVTNRNGKLYVEPDETAATAPAAK